MGLMERGMRFLADKQKLAAVAGVPVTYTRGNESAPLAVVVTDSPVSTTQPAQSQSVGRLTITDRDYVIRVEDLAAAGFGLPAKGDRITETINGVATTFEAGTRPGEAVYDWGEAERVTVIVHARAR